MKKQAALLFIPLFFVFGYVHQYRPGFTTPSHSQLANSDSSTEFDIYSNNTSDEDSGRGNFFSWENFRNRITGNKDTDQQAGEGSSNSSSNGSGTTIAATPRVPNTGGDSSVTTSTSSPINPPASVTPPVSPPASPVSIAPPTTITSPLTTFPQSSPPPPPQNSTTTTPPPATPAPTPTPPPPTPEPTPTPPPPIIPQLPPLIPPTTIITIGDSTTPPAPAPTPPPPPPPTNSPTTTTSTPPSTESATEPANEGAQPIPTASTTDPADSVPPPPINESVFTTGGVTFRFDDGWSSQYDTALPILEAAGIKGTFYIVTQQLSDDGFTGFMSKAQILQVAGGGHEIAAHTQTHPHMPTLTTAQQRAEINGSKADLQSWGLNPTSISYPYGEYTQNTVQLVKDAGFANAVTTVETPVSPSSDPYQLEGTSYQASDSAQKIEQDIQNAVDSHRWMILTFHRIDNSGDQYSTTPANFRAVVDYVKSHGIRTVTVSQGAASL